MTTTDYYPTQERIDHLVDRDIEAHSFREWIVTERNQKRDRKILQDFIDLKARAKERDCRTAWALRLLAESARAIGEIGETYGVETNDLSFLWYKAVKGFLVETVGCASDGPCSSNEDYDAAYRYCFELLHDTKRFDRETLGMPEKAGAFESFSVAELEACPCQRCRISRGE